MTSTCPRPRLRAVSAAAGLAAGIILAPPAAGIAEAAPEPTISVIVKSGTVQFHDWPPGGSIDVTVDGAPFGPYTFEDCEHGCDGLPVGIGSDVVVSDGTTTKDHTVTNLTITAVDETTNTVSGSADPDDVIDVWHHGDGAALQATTDASSVWTADFTGLVDFAPGTEGNSSETDDDGDQTWALWRIPNPVIQVAPATGSIWLNEFLPDESITITIDGASAGTYSTDEWGNFDGNNLGLTFDVAEGSDVVVSDGTTTKDHTVTNLTITAVDETTNTVSGSADPDDVIDVWHHGEGAALQATTDASSVWTADFTGLVDFAPGTEGNSSETDDDGDQTWAFWRVFDPWIGASVIHEEVWANDFPDEPAGQTLYYRLDDPATPDVDFESDMPLIVNHGQTEAGDRSFGRYDVQAGQTLTVRNRPFTGPLGDGVEKVLDLSRIEVTGVDGDADIITGYADQAEGPDVCVWSQDAQLCNGDAGFTWGGVNWTADFGSVGSDVKPGHWNSASQYDDDGDETHFWWNLPPWVVVELAEEDAAGVPLWPDAVRAEAWSGPVVTLTVNGAVIDTWTVTGDGHYTFELAAIDIEVGDVVTLSDSVDTKTITVEPLTIDQINFSGDAPPNTVFGTAASERDVRVEASASVGGWWAERWVNASASGSFTADFGNPGSGWREQWTADFGGAEGLGRHMRVEIYDPDNDRVETRTCEGVPRIEVTRSDGQVDAYDFPEGATVTLEITGAPDPFEAVSERNPENPCETIATFDLGEFEIPDDATVTATDDTGTPPVTHTVITFTIDAVDPDDDTVSGTGPADAQVLVEADGNWRYVDVDELGSWLADFAVSGTEPGEEQVVDLGPGSSGRAVILDELGNTTELSWRISAASFQVDPTSEMLWANEFLPNSEVSVTVDAADVPGSPFITDDGGNFGAGWDPADLDMQSGNEVILTDGATTKDHTIIALTVDSVDPDTNEVSGTAAADTELWVNADSGQHDVGRTVTADGSGYWSTDFDDPGDQGGTYDLGPGASGSAQQCDDDGDCTQVNWNIANPHFNVDTASDGVWGHEWTPNASVTVTIAAVDYGPFPVNEWGDFGSEWDPAPAVDPGSSVTVTDGTTTKDHTATPLAIIATDADTDEVFGVAAPNTSVDVWVHDSDAWRQVTAGGDRGDGLGEWSVDFTDPGPEPGEEGTADLGAGSNGNSSQCDDDGDCTFAGWNLANPYFTVRTSEQLVQGSDWSDGALVTLTIDDPRNGPGVDYSDSRVAEPAGWDPSQTYVEFRPFDEQGFEVFPGFEMEMIDSSTTKSHTVIDIRITEIDSDADTVSGIATPDSWITVHIHGTEVSRDVLSDHDGNFFADFANPGTEEHEQDTWDIGDGTAGEVFDTDDDGDQTQIDWFLAAPPDFLVHPFAEWIQGANWFNRPVTVTIYTDDTMVEELFGAEAGDFFDEGNFQLHLGGEFDIETGQYVVVTDGVDTKTHTVAELAVTAIDPDANTVSGMGDPGAEIGVEINGGPHVDAVVDPTGNWTADFSGFHDIVERTEGWAYDPDDDGDATQVDWRLPGPPEFGVTATHDWIEGYDFDGDLITFTIDDNDDENDGVLYEATIDIDPNNSNWLHVIDDFDIEAGQYVTVTDGFTTKATWVSPIQITDVDTQNWIVRGVADPNVEIDTFGFHPEIGSFGEHIVQVDANGDWELNLDDVIDPNQRPPEIPDGTVLGGGQRDDDLDRTVMFWDPASVEGYVLVDGEPVVDAEVFFQSSIGSPYTCTDENGYYSFDDASIVLMLVRGGIAATGRAVSADAGCSNPDFLDADGKPLVTVFEYGPFDLQDGYEYIQFDVERAAAYQHVFVWHDQDGAWVPADGVQVRVFDRNDPEFIDAHGTDPDPSLYEQIFHEGTGQFAMDFTVAYLLEEPGTVEMRYPYLTDVLVLVEYVDGSILGQQADADEFVDDGNGIYLGPTMVFPPPQVVADPFRELIRVRSFPTGGEITVGILDGPELTAIVEDGETVFDLFAMDPWLDLDTGDVITVTYDDFDVTTNDDAYQRELVVAPLGVHLVDDVEDVIHGTTEPGRTVVVSANTNEAGAERYLVADGNGEWAADFGDPEFGEPVDIDKTTMWQLFMRVPDDDGDATVYETPLATPGLSALPELGIIGSEGSGLGPITITIPEIGYEVTGEPEHEPGPIVIGDFEFDPLSSGSELYTYGFGADVTGVHDLTSGTVIHSSYVLWEMTLMVMDVTVDEVDTVADTVSGWVERPGIVATFVVPEPMSLAVIEPLETNEWTLTPFDVVDDEFADQRDITSVDVGLVFAGDSPGESFDIYTQVLWDLKPHITTLELPFDPIDVDTPVDLHATFTDIETPDDHTVHIDWGDGLTTEIFNADMTVDWMHEYSEPGIYTVQLTVTDGFGHTDVATHQFVVVFDPNGGFVSGGGWIDSPAGAYAPDPTLTGRANFGFVSKYKKGKVTPDGNANFRFQTAGLHFQSTEYDWLVITGGDHAKFKGSGTINGLGDYGFMITAIDDPAGDTFRIKIWDRGTGETVYDNKAGIADDDYDATRLGGGSIVVHKGK